MHLALILVQVVHCISDMLNLLNAGHPDQFHNKNGSHSMAAHQIPNPFRLTPHTYCSLPRRSICCSASVLLLSHTQTGLTILVVRNWSHRNLPQFHMLLQLLLLLSHTQTSLTILIVRNWSHRDLPGNHAALLLFLPSLTPHSYNKILEEHAQK